MIKYFEDSQTFIVSSHDFCYRIKIAEGGYLLHAYAGVLLPDEDLSYLLRLNESPPWSDDARDKVHFMDNIPMEYPCGGIGDFRAACLQIADGNGNAACDIRYQSHKIIKGKPSLPGLPATFTDDGETLEITCWDAAAEMQVVLRYSTFGDVNVIARSADITNKGGKTIRLRRALSICLDLDGHDYDMIHLTGAWGRERSVNRFPLQFGWQGVSSVRGESSHQSNPFMALAEKNATEDTGEVFGLSLVYSGNFIAQAEVTSMGATRACMGINPESFEWVLEPGETFTVPEALLAFSAEGIGGMSRAFHDLFRNHLIRGAYKDKKRPVLINNWEGTGFNFDTDKLVAIARESVELGIEMLVMDDGWFGKRDDDNSGLGDWTVNERKLPGGLKALVDQVNALGMKFGIWFEPEMVSPDSDLYRAHPDWCLHMEGRTRTRSRNQLVLDFSRPEVRENIYAQIHKILSSANIEYVKWDMNRNLTEAGSDVLPAERRMETMHRYTLGVYDMMEKMLKDFPHLLLEGCSGGGGRFDPGMLYYCPQIWTSDDTDAIERLEIQYGTSMVYPLSSMGAHVSAVPNWAAQRSAPMQTRGHVALWGTFGYELDMTLLSQEERKEIPAQIAEYHKYNALISTGDLYRIGNNPLNHAWMVVAKDKSEALFQYVQVLARPNHISSRVKLKGLDKEAFYKNEETGAVLSGAALMHAGIPVFLRGDFVSMLAHFIKI